MLVHGRWNYRRACNLGSRRNPNIQHVPPLLIGFCASDLKIETHTLDVASSKANLLSIAFGKMPCSLAALRGLWGLCRLGERLGDVLFGWVSVLAFGLILECEWVGSTFSCAFV